MFWCIYRVTLDSGSTYIINSDTINSLVLESRIFDRHTCDVLKTGDMASGGRGNMISTDVAVLLSLNCDLAFTKYSVLLRLCFSTWHSTHISGLTC